MPRHFWALWEVAVSLIPSDFGGLPPRSEQKCAASVRRCHLETEGQKFVEAESRKTSQFDPTGKKGNRPKPIGTGLASYLEGDILC